MADLLQSKFELVHTDDGKQIRHGESVLDNVTSVEKEDVDGVPYVVFRAELGSEVYNPYSRFVLSHDEEGDIVKHAGVTLEGVESVTTSIEGGKCVVTVKAALAGEDFTSILKRKEVKKPQPKVVPEVKPQ
jgi:hypothetical protein